MSNLTSVIRQRALDLWNGGAGAGEIYFDTEAERYGLWEVDAPLPILPGIHYRMRSPQVSCLRRSTPGPVFVWEGHVSPFDGLCAHWSISHLRVEFTDAAKWDPSSIAISLPVPAPIVHFEVRDLRIHSAHHAVKDLSGSFNGAWRRIGIQWCSRGFEKVGGTMTLLENVLVGGKQELWWDNIAFRFESTWTTMLVCCGVDPFISPPGVEYGVAHFKDTRQTQVNRFQVENITIADEAPAVLTREGIAEGLEVSGIGAPGLGPRRRNGSPAALTNW
ncbi:hypothetical protein [Ideonella sp. YS5]|uniref:hypothetical protein n=1 Tax=Ideonella sp. YS5 TaxID=3453714 RepID=UPI003EEC35B1